MAFREVRVFEIREVLRLWLRGEGLRSIERLVRWTVRRPAVTSTPRWTAASTVTAGRGS